MAFDFHKVFVVLFKAFRFQILGCERFHDADSRQSVFKMRVKFRNLFPVLPENPVKAVVVKISYHRENGNGRENYEREFDVNRHKVRERSDEFHDDDENFFGAMVRTFRDIEKVGRAATHKFADLVVVVKTCGKAHELVKKAHSDILFDARAHNVSDGRHVVSARDFDNFHGNHYSRDLEQKRPFEVVAQNVVHKNPYKHGEHKPRNRHYKRRQQIERE